MEVEPQSCSKGPGDKGTDGNEEHWHLCASTITRFCLHHRRWRQVMHIKLASMWDEEHDEMSNKWTRYLRRSHALMASMVRHIDIELGRKAWKNIKRLDWVQSLLTKSGGAQSPNHWNRFRSEGTSKKPDDEMNMPLEKTRKTSVYLARAPSTVSLNARTNEISQ